MSPFKRNLIIGYSFSLILLLAGTVASYISIRGLLRNNESVEHTNLVIRKVENMISILKDAETGQRGFLLTGDEQFLDPYKGSLDKVYDEIKELKVLTADNQLQQLTLIRFTDVVQNRMNVLQQLVEVKRAGKTPATEDLRTGKIYMDQARQLVKQMEDREQLLLVQRTKDASQFAESTPLFIIIASLLAVLITIVSFFRVNADFSRRQRLQVQLLEKDKEITERINIISSIAEKVTGGNYSVRVDEGYEDKLGSLAVSLNKMTDSLHDSFTQLSQKEWLQTGISQLNEEMLGEQTLESVTEKIVQQLTSYTGSDLAAFYYQQEGRLEFKKGFAFLPGDEKKFILPGEGIAGQAMLSDTMISLANIRQTEILINYAAGEIIPREVLALPLWFEGKLKAVLVLAAIKPYKDRHRQLLETVAENIAIVINTAETRKRLNELLQETQTQSEELMSQHNELENINRELEAQSERLKVSEEELKVQQEELLQSNSELEERTRLLEERNRLIAEKNMEIVYKAEQLEQSSKYKSEFLANMSHELRTPLNSILLLSRLMADNPGGNLSGDQVDYAKVIQSSGHGLLSLIDEILDLSRIESGKMEMEYAEISINEIIQDMRSLFNPVAADKKLAFDITTGPGLPLKIETDLPRVEQVLKNLLSNAFKFTASGKVQLDINTKDEAFISFSVKDSGIGIANEKQQLVFEAFRQEDGSTRRNYGGTGLGLSISRELAKLLGGEISLESEQGKGSVFTLVLPVKKAVQVKENMLQPATIVMETNTSSVRKTTVAPPAVVAGIADDRKHISLHDKVIVIIEDDTVFAQALLDFTHKNAYKGIIAVRGDEGLQLAKQFHPIGILLDIHLPVMDGWEVLEALKSDPGTRHIPVHVMSSMEARNKSLSAGAIDFSGKPLAAADMEKIFKKIGQVTQTTAKKVLIVEEDPMHAKALAYFLEANKVNAGIIHDIDAAIDALLHKGTDCVILDMGVPGQSGYELLEQVRKTNGLETIPIIVFTGKSLSAAEELRIKKYADSIVVKTAHSYKRMLDEVSLFLHLVETNNGPAGLSEKSRMLQDVLINKKVLLVDDDVRNIYSLTKAMEQYNINVVTAIDGKDALKQLEANKDVQLLLMDMMMPEMDGYETTRQVRRLPAFAKLPIIAVTAKAMTGDRDKCIQAGASDYITKPVDTDQLISLLRVWLYDSK